MQLHCHLCRKVITPGEIPFVWHDKVLCAICYEHKAEDQLVYTIRKWYLTICHDLCIAPFPIEIHRKLHMGPYNAAAVGSFHGRYELTWSEEYRLVGQIALAPVGGHGEQDYLFTLAHECRHAWQFVNGIPATERDCNEYAQDFMQRIRTPQAGHYCDAIPRIGGRPRPYYKIVGLDRSARRTSMSIYAHSKEEAYQLARKQGIFAEKVIFCEGE